MKNLQSKEVQRESLTWQSRFTQSTLILLMIMFAALGFTLIYLCHNNAEKSIWYYVLAKVGEAIFISSIIAGAVKWFMAKRYTDLIKSGQKVYRDEYQEELKKTLENLEKGILNQTDYIAKQASSIESMQKSDIKQLYHNRNVAANDIKTDIEEPSITYLRLIGISFNDFLRSGDNPFHKAWETIEHYVRAKKIPQKRIDIKLLLVDPACSGAYHRSKAEETIHVGIPSRLDGEVKDSIDFLHKLIHESSTDHVSFDVRLYRMPPILNLVQTDFVSYFQQYHFWPQHNSNVNIPVLKFQGRSSTNVQGRSIHDDLGFHFNYLWDFCSTSLHDYVECFERGYDKALRE